MKFSLIKNDKTTAKDEVILLFFILICIAIGTLLIWRSPAFWVITAEFSKGFGVVWIIVAVMFIPGLIYRLCTNERK